ncbi:MAG TPA: hypothetical protein VN442_14270 [Bryobacteraceae bacterium]|nr:hypothetical protein [Bryobacteraceae bacterium]
MRGCGEPRARAEGQCEAASGEGSTEGNLIGAILSREHCDPRLRALEQAAHADMHDLPVLVARSMEVAAAAKLREQARIIQQLQQAEPPKWLRPCWACGAPGACEHREEGLVGVWQK